MKSAEFSEKYVAQGRRLFLLALRLTGNPTDAEDAVQDVMARLWERRAELDAVESPEAYAQIILRRRCLDILDRNRLHHTEELSSANLHPPFSTDFDTRDRVAIVLRLIDALPEPQRRVLRMRDVEGHELSEIEAATGLSAGNIRVILSRARAAIKSRFSL